MKYEIKIGNLFPDLLNLYGDRGNITVLEKRLLWRNIEVATQNVFADDAPDFKEIDIVMLGGGSDRELCIVCDKLRKHQKELKEYIEAGGVMLAVCGGYQILGKYFYANGEKHEGLDVLNIYSEQSKNRFVGDIIIETLITGEKTEVIGFENHQSKTYIEEYEPFGKVIFGKGNNGEDYTCGVVYKNLVGTYLHGPLLPKNPKIADHLIKTALLKKYGEKVETIDLCDNFENDARDYILKKYLEK